MHSYYLCIVTCPSVLWFREGSISKGVSELWDFILDACWKKMNTPQKWNSYMVFTMAGIMIINYVAVKCKLNWCNSLIEKSVQASGM